MKGGMRGALQGYAKNPLLPGGFRGQFSGTAPTPQVERARTPFTRTRTSLLTSTHTSPSQSPRGSPSPSSGKSSASSRQSSLVPAEKSEARSRGGGGGSFVACLGSFDRGARTLIESVIAIPRERRGSQRRSATKEMVVGKGFRKKRNLPTTTLPWHIRRVRTPENTQLPPRVLRGRGNASLMTPQGMFRKEKGRVRRDRRSARVQTSTKRAFGCQQRRLYPNLDNGLLVGAVLTGSSTIENREGGRYMGNCLPS